MPHLVDLIVDRRIFFNEGIGRRDIRLRLVVVVVADEVLDGVVRKEAFEFAVQLGGQDLVRRQHQRGARFRFATTFATVKVLPDPVTPSKT